MMDVHVVIATKGRPQALTPLLDRLAAQTLLPSTVTLVGTCRDDVAGVEQHPIGERCQLNVLLSQSGGLCIQRNCGIEHLAQALRAKPSAQPFFVVFFDDDYRPHSSWLEQAHAIFDSQSEVVGLTGRVLADGVHGEALSEAEADEYLAGSRRPERHWASGDEPRALTSMYGCNMAFRDRVVSSCRFDENLPLYGWQEDRDFTARAAVYGQTIYTPHCVGVHLGSRSGRVSGLRFGYSQVANPFYMWRKGTMSGGNGLRFVTRNFVSNSVRTLQLSTRYDYPGRLRGNLLAMRDLIRGSCHPLRVLHIQ